MQETTLTPNASVQRQKSLLVVLSILVCFVFLCTASGQNTIGTVAGGPPFNGLALQTAIPNPTGIAEDPSGNIYIASQYSYYVYQLSPTTGVLSIFAGTGVFGFGQDGIPATTSALSSPVAVGVDKNTGNVYIVDGNRIRVVSNGIISTYADVSGANCPNAGNTPPTCGDGGPASQATFFAPQAIYIDGSGNLLIADTTDEEIRFINTGSNPITVAGITIQPGTVNTVAGNGLTCNGPFDACGDGGSATAQGKNGAKIDLPEGVVSDSAGNIYIGDTRDQRIRCVPNVAGGCPNTINNGKTTAGQIWTYAGIGSPVCPGGTSSCGDGGPKLAGKLHNPAGLWLDSANNLYIADQWDNRIRQVTPGVNGLIGTVCGLGTAGFQDGTCPKGVQFYGPLAIIFDAAGNVTIADSGNGLIRQGKISTRAVKTIAGSGTDGDNGPASLANLANPVDVKWDLTGTNYYIVDNGNNSIREVNSSGTITTVVGSGHPSQTNGIGDGGPATKATLNNPSGMALDAAGNIYVADSTNSVVRVVNTQSGPITVGGVVVQPGTIQTVAGQDGAVGCEPANAPCGDGGLATAANMDFPIAVAVDSNGNIYISDFFDDRIRCVANVAGGCPTMEQVSGQNVYPTTVGEIVTVAGPGGGAGQLKDGVIAVTATLTNPYGLGIWGSSNLYLDDSGHDEVRCLAGVNGGCGPGTKQDFIYDEAFHLNQRGFGGDGLAATATQTLETVPQGLAFDPSGNLYTGGGGDLVVRRIDATTQKIMTVAGNPKQPGFPGFAGDGGPSVGATLDNLGMAVNGNEQLLIADQGNNRIRQVDMVPLATLFKRNLNFGTITVGQVSPSQTATMQNYGLATLPIQSTVLLDTTNFAIVAGSNTCVTQLAPGPVSGAGLQSTCTAQVVFQPQSSGKFTTTLTFNTSVGAEVVTLTGTGQ